MLNLSKLNDQNKVISELDRNPRTVDQLLREIEDSKVRKIMDEVLFLLFVFCSKTICRMFKHFPSLI